MLDREKEMDIWTRDYDPINGHFRWIISDRLKTTPIILWPVVAQYCINCGKIEHYCEHCRRMPES